MKALQKYPVDDNGAVLDGHDSLLLECLEDPFVLGPGDVLDGRVSLDVTPDHALETPRDVLNVRVERNPGRI